MSLLLHHLRLARHIRLCGSLGNLTDEWGELSLLFFRVFHSDLWCSPWLIVVTVSRLMGLHRLFTWKTSWATAVTVKRLVNSKLIGGLGDRASDLTMWGSPSLVIVCCCFLVVLKLNCQFLGMTRVRAALFGRPFDQMRRGNESLSLIHVFSATAI